MIICCRRCHSPIFHGPCLCGQSVMRCPDCGGDGRQKMLELMDDDEGYLGYVLKTQKEVCETCGGNGEVSVYYHKVEE